MKQVILASQSPRRRDLLEKMGVSFTAHPSNFNEQLDDSRESHEVAIELALGKAQEVAKSFPDAVVIGSDTIVVTADGRQLEKPKDRVEAKAMLYSHATGKKNEVISAVAVVCINDGVVLTGKDSTFVFFKPYDNELVDVYVATGDSLDKAGGYGIQSGAAELIDYIDGYEDTVIGFPTHLVAELLSKVGVEARAVTIDLPVRQAKSL